MVWVFLAAVFCLLSVSAVYGVSRGIKVVSDGGKTLQLYDEYHALVVGVSNYEKWPKLPYAKSDAADVADKLSHLGFEVKVVLDPTSRELNTAINEMVYTMGREENRALLFYYAGHGDTELLADGTKMGYLVPRDCPLRRSDPLGFATHAVSMRDIESASLRMKARHVLMLFDSCFSGSLFALVRAVPDDITEKSLLPVRQYITAGNEDEQVPDRSMFKRCFLLGLEGDADLTGDGYVTGSELGMYLSDKVVNYSHRRQHPQYGKINNPNLDRGDFVFVAPAKEEDPAPAAAQGASSEMQSENARLAEEIEQLRREKEELLQMKKLMEEKNRLKEELQKEKTKIRTAKLATEKRGKVPPPSDNKIAGRDGNFIACDDGIIKDATTGLEWFVGPDRNIDWNEARYLAKNLKIGGGGWRMPSIDELKSLYKKGKGKRNISPLFKTTGWYVWSGKEDYGRVMLFSFFDGYGKDLSFIELDEKNGRAFAVRSRSAGRKSSALETSQTSDSRTKRAGESAGDGNFIAYDNGIIKDKKSGLEWFVGPDEKSNFSDAGKFIVGLKLDGGGWRLPTSDELKTLYLKDRGKSNMSPLFKTTGYWVWSNDRATYSQANEVGFDFRKGEIEEIQIGSAWKGSRVFAVRSNQDERHYSTSIK